VTCLYTPSTTTCDSDGIVTIAGEGTYTLDSSTGVVTYVADSAATVGTKTSITYKVTDIFGQTATSTLTPIIPLAPVAVDDTSSGAYDTNQTISPLTNDSATSPATLVAGSVKLCASTSTANASCNLSTLTVANEGNYTVDAAGTVTFDPLPTFTGTASPVKYVVSDNVGQLASATITPTVGVPSGPTAAAETKTVIPGGKIVFTTLTGVSGLGISTIGFTASSTCLIVPGSSPAVCDADGVVVIPNEGTYTLDATTGLVTFAADANVTPGKKSSLTYRITDISGQTATSTLTPIIPEPPVLVDDSSTGPWNVSQKITPLANDKAGAESTLLTGSVQICATSSVKTTATVSCSGTSLVIRNEGTYTVATDGSVRFVPLSTFSGTATPIAYSVTDSNGQIASAKISVVVLPPKAPIAVPEVVKVTNRAKAIQFTTLTGKKGLATSVAGLNASSTCLLVPASVPAICDEDGIVAIPNEGTYKLDKRTGLVTFLASPRAKAGKQSSLAYQVTDKAGQKVQSTLTPIIPAPPVKLPVTGADNSGPLVLGGFILLALGFVATRGRRYLSV
jgi:LPXTG-motif cell wall-anchored protein